MEPKAKTFTEKLGFVDSDLKTPKHDELMMYLDRNILELLNIEKEHLVTIEEYNKFQLRINEFKEKFTKETREKASLFYINPPKHIEKEYEDIYLYKGDRITWEQYEKVINHKLKPFTNTLKLITKLYKKWEYPVTAKGNNNFIIGYVDFYVVVEIPYLDFRLNNDYEICTEIRYVTKVIYIELKTTIPSLGELIRQVNTYKQHIENRIDFRVFCPDSKFKDILAEQGIGFIEYKTF